MSMFRPDCTCVCRIYYQFDTARLRVCTLPVRALLYIASDIRRMGPVWCYWAFAMERFCGSLVVSIKSRKHPYTFLAHRVRDIARLSMIKVQYGLTDELDTSQQREVMSTGRPQTGCKYNVLSRKNRIQSLSSSGTTMCIVPALSVDEVLLLMLK